MDVKQLVEEGKDRAMCFLIVLFVLIVDSGGTTLITSRGTVLNMGYASAQGGDGGSCDKSLQGAQSGGGQTVK